MSLMIRFNTKKSYRGYDSELEWLKEEVTKSTFFFANHGASGRRKERQEYNALIEFENNKPMKAGCTIWEKKLLETLERKFVQILKYR